MKKFIYALLFLSLTASGYSQLVFANADSVGNHLKGSWKFFRRCGGLIGGCQYPTTLGYSYDLTFQKIPSSPDSLSYQLSKTGTTTVSGKVKISSTSGQWFLSKINGLTNVNSIFSAKADTINISEDCPDCYGYTFSRTKTVGLTEIMETHLNLQVYPNPAENSIWVSVKKSETIQNLIIYDQQGAVVKVFKEGSYSCDISELPAGLYFVSGRAKGQILHQKFLKT